MRTEMKNMVQNYSRNIEFTGPESIIKLLIESGADVNAVNNVNNTALILAISKSKSYEIEAPSETKLWKQQFHSIPFHLEFESAAELLIERGAEVNVVGEFDTPLIWATNNGKSQKLHLIAPSFLFSLIKSQSSEFEFNVSFFNFFSIHL